MGASGSEPLEPYDQPAYERFCRALVTAGFEPVPGTLRRDWRGPIRPSLSPLTGANRMTVRFRDGWPHVSVVLLVPELLAEHVTHGGQICLWADDDPAQQSASDIENLWQRADEWAAAARAGFGPTDAALDAFAHFDSHATPIAELDLPGISLTFMHGSMGALYARQHRLTLQLTATHQRDTELYGHWYAVDHVNPLPRTLNDIRNALTNAQRRNLDRGLRRRDPHEHGKGGHDLLVLTWPRHHAREALVVTLSGAPPNVSAAAHQVTATDTASLTARAGPDAEALHPKRVLLIGAGSVGGHLALAAATTGIGHLSIADNDTLLQVNVVRHVCGSKYVGWQKTDAVKHLIGEHAPATTVDTLAAVPLAPTALTAAIIGYDLVIDATGQAPVTAALAGTCAGVAIPLITVALYHAGVLLRVRRQAPTDTPLTARPGDPSYLQLPPDDPTTRDPGFLELGCLAPINNAPPTSAATAAALTAIIAVDLLTGRLDYPDETVQVLRPLTTAPFDRVGLVTP